MDDILGNLNDLQKEINKITGVKTIDDYKAENARLRKAGEAMAKGISDFDDWADSTHYNPHSPFGLRLLGLRQNVKDWREACGE